MSNDLSSLVRLSPDVVVNSEGIVTAEFSKPLRDDMTALDYAFARLWLSRILSEIQSSTLALPIVKRDKQ